MMTTMLVSLLVLLLVGALPIWPYSANWASTLVEGLTALR